jgi:hypothetical protein
MLSKHKPNPTVSSAAVTDHLSPMRLTSIPQGTLKNILVSPVIPANMPIRQ